MTADQLELWRKIEAFDIDGAPRDLTFAVRLARENGWSRRFAERAIREYKRFVFLAMTAGRHMCPSEQVDQVWHLHLTYTRSYWQRFCGEVLGTPLHHEPTRGGDSEGRKHWAMYADTLLAYEDAFDEPAPADLWPAADQRFGTDLEISRVNRSEFWLVRKPRISKRVAMAGALAVSIFFAFGCAGDPFEEKGADFLPYYFAAWGMAFILGLIVRRVYKGQEPNPDAGVPELDPYEIAYLTGGRPRVLATALVRLKDTGAADVGDDGHVVIRRVPMDGDQVERAVMSKLTEQSGNSLDLRPLNEALKGIEDARFARLRDEGLLSSRSNDTLGRLLPLLLTLGTMGLVGLPRLFLGLSNGRPSGYLMVSLFVTFAITMLTFFRPLRRTRKAEVVLANLSNRNARLRTLRGDLHPGDPSLAVALFGATVLSGTVYAAVYNRIHKFDASGSGGGCGTASGCGGGGGGGCGGGCGGGGCGGCGGGD